MASCFPEDQRWAILLICFSISTLKTPPESYEIFYQTAVICPSIQSGVALEEGEHAKHPNRLAFRVLH